MSNQPGIPIIGFFRERETYGCFSNWYAAEFYYAGKHFAHAEQFMMYHKVLMFGKHDLAEQIMRSTDPGICKNIARQPFPEFDSKLWSRTRKAIVKRGIRAKFRQNPDILAMLLGTGNALIAECSANDTTWGIGFGIDDERWHDVSTWRGKNLLGRILMEVREEFRREMALCPSASLAHDPDYYNRDIPQWNTTPGALRLVPQYYDAIHAYADTLDSYSTRQAFYHSHTLADWENLLLSNQSGSLLANGFFEMKWDIYDTARSLEGAGASSDSRVAFCRKHIPSLQVIDANANLKEQCRRFSVYAIPNMQRDLYAYLSQFMLEAYDASMVIPNYRDLVEECGAERWVAEPVPELLQTLDAEHILGCIAWHFRRDHFVEGSLISRSIAAGHMLRMMETYLEKASL